MDFKQIQELIKIVGKSDLIELKIEQDNFKITLKKGDGAPVAFQQPQRLVMAEAPQAQSAPVAEAPSSEEKKEAPKADNKHTTIKSPMVGTFYRSPSPDKDPFVKVGDIIKKGDHICIIEAMKLFNEIESEVEGKVIKILAEDASPVEYDQPLFLIDPSGV